MATVGLTTDSVAERQLRDLDALHRAAMRSAGRASAMLRGAATGVLVDDGRLRGLQPLARRRLLPALVRAMALAHLLGRRRATIEAGRRDDVALDVYSDVKRVLRRTVGVRVKDLEVAYGRRAADALRQAVRKVDARVRGTLAEIGAAPTSRARALKLVSDALDGAGLGPEDASRLETVFRTSMLQAASIGRWQTFDEMGEDGPWGYRYVQIDRPTKRLEHVPLHGVTLPRDDPFWLTYWAPNGWNCECQCVPVWRSRPLRRPRILPELDPEFESSPEDWADELVLAFAWDESKHPREEAGTSEGGQFTDSVLSVWKGEPERIYKSEMGVADSALAEEFNSALDKLPKYEGIVWRGAELRDNSLKPGAVWRQPHSAAASIESKYATNYAGALPDGRLLVLKIASKTGALLKGDEDENEVILRRKSSYRLEKVTDEKLGSQYFAVAHLVEVFDIKLAWDESKHPREEKGSSKGGEFAEKSSIEISADVAAVSRLKEVGVTAEEAAALAGALDGAKVAILAVGDTKLSVQVSHDDYQANRVLQIESKTIYNSTMTAYEHAPKGTGTRVLATQVKAAVAAGYEKILTTAAGSPGPYEDMNGYYTWPRLGYDGAVPYVALDYASKHKLERVSDFMRTKKHRDWWRENGDEFQATFDLRKGSLSRTVLDAYVESKNIKLAWDEDKHPRHEEGAPAGQGGEFAPKNIPSNTLSEKLGDCYESSFNEALYGEKSAELAKALNTTVKLVHGYPVFPDGHPKVGQRMGHGWVEVGPLVIDHGKIIPKALYYQQLGLDEDNVYRYEGTEVMRAAIKAKTYGPFVKPPKDAVFRESQGLPDLKPALKKVLDKIERKYPAYDTEAKETLFRYTKDGSLDNVTRERLRLHDQIVADARDGVAEGHAKPVYVLLGGGPASGKTTLVRSGKLDTVPADHVLAGGDDIKELLPEYVAMTKHGDARAAGYVHEESSELSKRVVREALAAKQHVVHDGTGDASFKGLQKKTDAARKAGALVVGEYATVSTETALKRAAEREKKTKRHMPPTVLKDIHENISRLVPLAVREGLFDKFRLWDNEDEPTLVMSAVGKKMTIHDEPKWRAFLKKAN